VPALAAWSFGPAEASAVTAPTLVVAGADSRPWFHENATILAGMLPHAETLILPGVNHLAPLADPAALAQAIADFVRQVPARY
jgi:pimeloyl-ACP methyl ester carboxylesterase